MYCIDNAFLTYACNILADTNNGLSGLQIVEHCNAYAVDFGRTLPYDEYPFDAPNKRTALKENLKAFEPAEQYQIIKGLCELLGTKNNEKVSGLKLRLVSTYGALAKDRLSETELIQKTKHWLADYPESLKQYENALAKYENGVFQRNTLDDMRLAFELLVKDLLGNKKSLENQLSDIGSMLKASGSSSELQKMIEPIIKYYTHYQNNHVKHNDAVNEIEIEYVIELTSVLMKYLIKAANCTKR